ncbi:MAG: hypothetical protein LBJ59_02900 [Zoogloeaceae bacterium]|jgi:hypothetical protein|nr:hypothetical protein [Zoogloeaceae bacterium]
MKAQELIKALQAFPPELDVYAYAPENEPGGALLEVEKADLAQSEYWGDVVVLDLEVA